MTLFADRERKMKPTIGTTCVRDVVTVTPATGVAAAAALMRKHHIGAVVVVDERDLARKPKGVLTDRDIVVEVVAAGLDAKSISVGEILQRPVVTVSADATCADVVREMSINGVRRMPVVDADGGLVGIVALDDVLLELVTPLVALGDLASRERRFETVTRAT
jgi:CBS domain-containing protein